MAIFGTAIERILTNEGVWADDPVDRGGKTKYGITEGFLKQRRPGWRIRDLTKTQAVYLYRQYFWDKLGLQKVTNQEKAEMILDSAINHGRRLTGRMVQRSINLLSKTPHMITEDGLIGPRTIKELNRLSLKSRFFLMAMRGERFKIYSGLCRRDWKQKRFIEGWLHRIQKMSLQRLRNAL